MKALIAGGVALAMLSLTGCAAKVQEIPHGNGGTGFVIECNGAFQRWGSCYKKASELCEGGTFDVSNTQALTQIFGGAFVFSGTQDRSMVIKCDQMYSEEEYNRLMKLYTEQFIQNER